MTSSPELDRPRVARHVLVSGALVALGFRVVRLSPSAWPGAKR